MDTLTVAIVVPASMTDALLQDESVMQPVTGVTRFKREDSLRLGLQDAANVLTVVIGAIQLGEYCARLARTLFKSKLAPGAYILVRVPTNDTKIQIDRFETEDDLTDAITRAATEAR